MKMCQDRLWLTFAMCSIIFLIPFRHMIFFAAVKSLIKTNCAYVYEFFLVCLTIKSIVFLPTSTSY